MSTPDASRLGSSTFLRARDRLLAADRAEAHPNVACQEVVRALHQVTTFDWSALMTTDPETNLPSGGVVEGFTPDACVPFWDNELTDPDFLKYAELARRHDPVATLHEATDGDLARSPRYTRLYGPLGAVDELRIAFMAGGTCLAIGAFVRAERDGPFPDTEVAAVRELLPLATRVLRRALGRGLDDAATTPPTVIILDSANQVTSMTPGARDVLDDLRIQVDGDLPSLVHVAAAKARWSRTTTNLTTRLRDRHGRWLRMHVSSMDGNTGTVVITISPAGPGDLAQVLLDSYGLTTRETEIVLRICRGLSTTDISAELLISPHTVRDHVKVIFSKAGVSSRGELVAQLFTNHLLGDFEASTDRIDGPDAAVRHVERL